MDEVKADDEISIECLICGYETGFRPDDEARRHMDVHNRQHDRKAVLISTGNEPTDPPYGWARGH